MTSSIKVLYNFDDLNKCFDDENILIKNKNIEILNVAFDSRQVKKGSLFFALKGENNDGHNYIKNVIDKDVECIVCEYIPENCKQIILEKNINIILVKDSFKSLQKLAKFQRNRLKAKVIGITGNIGKTTIREMLNSVLSGFFKTFTTYKNYNSQIGLPSIICNTPIDTEILILELGMSYKGEMNILSDIAKPDIVLITKIAPAHIGNFKDIYEVVDAKAEIFNGMNKQGVVILDKKGDYYEELVEKAKQQKINNIIDINDNNIYIDNIIFNEDLTTSFDAVINNNKIKCKINGIVKHNPFNCLFVFAISNYLKLDLNKVSQQFEKFKIVNGRGDFQKINFKSKNITIINDCYNSSPEALKSSINTFGELKNILNKNKSNNRLIAIIGDMLELGNKSYDYHKEIADCLIDNKIENVISIGKESKTIFDSIENKKLIIKNYYFENVDVFLKDIDNFINDNDYILLKASRGMNFDKIINYLKSCK